jgi:iron-sulfur cluster repair protein YtfE (RIC family)
MAIDAFEMALIHQTFRDELAKAPGLIRGVRAGDTRRSKVVSDHVVNIMSLLHHHHEAEDDILWPLLRTRVPVSANDCTRMQDEHLAVAAAMDRVANLRSLWAETADPGRADELIAAVDDLSARLAEHLADEEEHVVPLINAHITTEEWNVLLARGAAALNRKNVQFVLAFASFVLQDASTDERRRFMAGVPAGPRLLLKVFGQRAFDSYRARVYSS